MKAPVSLRLSWRRTALAITPGAWLLLQQTSKVGRPVSWEISTLIAAVSIGVTMSLVAAVLVTSLRLERRITPWALPSLGALVWGAGSTLEWLYWANRAGWVSDTLWTVSVLSTLVSLILLGVWVLYLSLRKIKTMNHASARVLSWLQGVGRGGCLPGAGLLCLLLLVTLAEELSYDHPLLFVSALRFVLLSLPVAVGLYFARRDGLLAGLLVLGCEPVWLDMLFRYRQVMYELLESSNQLTHPLSLGAAMLTLSYLPFLWFLVAGPLGLLRSQTESRRLRWLLLPSLVVLGTIGLVRGLALQGTPFEYVGVDWLRTGLLVGELWLPLLIAVTLYRAPRHRPDEVRLTSLPHRQALGGQH